MDKEYQNLKFKKWANQLADELREREKPELEQHPSPGFQFLRDHCPTLLDLARRGHGFFGGQSSNAETEYRYFVNNLISEGKTQGQKPNREFKGLKHRYNQGRKEQKKSPFSNINFKKAPKVGQFVWEYPGFQRCRIAVNPDGCLSMKVEPVDIFKGDEDEESAD